MRIFYSPPKMGDLFKHDSPLLNVMASGVVAFLLLSSITVFAGFALHFSLTGWRLALYGLGIYPLLCLAPDLVNLACFSWLVRTLLKWRELDQQKGTTGILLVVCLSLSGICSWYSFNLSQVSAQQVAEWMKPRVEGTVQEDEELNRQARNIMALDSQSISRHQGLFAQQKASLERLYQSQINALRADSIRWESLRKPSNTLWIDKKLQPVFSALQSVRFQRDTSIAGLVQRHKKEVDQSASLGNQVSDLLLHDAQNAVKQKQEVQQQFQQRHSFISSLISTIAGHAILILLALGAVREILHHRNEITPLPVLGPFDLQNLNAVKEVVLLPLKALGRIAINQSRKWQRLLPPLEDPIIDGYVYDFQAETRIVKVKTAETACNQPETGRETRLREVDNKETEEETRTAVNNGGVTEDRMIRQCLNCGKDYRIRSFNQKYCSTECKSQYHANKNGGRKFNPSLYHNGRQKD